MIKFFRKHNKKLLSVFMVLLMVVFLGGSALESFFRPQLDRVVGTSRWGDITILRLNAAEQTTQILQTLGWNWQQPFGAPEALEPLDWIMLVEEAKDLGTYVDIEWIRSGLVDEQGMEETARRMRMKPDRILRAMAEFDSIQETASAISGAAVPSEAYVEASAATTLAKVKMNAVMLPAAALLDEVRTFGEDEIAAQFAAFREREEGEGLDFGYYVKPKVQIQYIKIDRDKLAGLVRVVNLEKKAKDHYTARHTFDPAFRRPSDETTEEVEGPVEEKPPYLTWEESREIAEKAVRKQEATDVAIRIGDWLVRYMSDKWIYQTRGDDGYRPVPEQVSHEEYYSEVLGRFPKSLSYPGTVSTFTSEFFSQEEAQDVPDIGSALYVSANAGVFENLGDLAFRTQAIIPKIPGERGTIASEYLAPYQTCRHPLRDRDANVFLFRVMDVQPAHIPSNVDEVRDRVVADLRLKWAYEEAMLRGEALASCEDGGTLEEAYEADAELVALRDTEAGRDSGFFEVPPVAIATQYQVLIGARGSGTAVGVRELGTIPTEVIEAWFELEDYGTKTKLFELKDRASVLVVEWVETQAAGANEFATMRESFTQGLEDQRKRAVLTDWLRPANIRARSRYAVATN